MAHLKNYFTWLMAASMLLAGCEKDFDETNINRVDPITLDAQFVMNNAIILTTYPDNFQTLGMLCYNRNLLGV